MAAYCQVYGVIHFVTCGLTACTPGSAPGPKLGNEYGKTLPFLLHLQLAYTTARTTVQAMISRLILYMANQCTKFEISHFSHSRDILGDPQF